MEDMIELSGREIKGYKLLKQIGSSGHSVVYQAHHTATGRDVAIKTILPALANQPEFIRMFASNVLALARLEHPHIVPLYDYWRSPDGAFLVMRWLHNGNLCNALQDGPFDLHTATAMLNQLSGALSAAHRNSLLHRNIKPTNVLFDEDENIYLSDFSISGLGIAGEASTSAGTTSRTLADPSAEGDCLSPEQARHEPETAQTDIYALAILVYEALMGVHPFTASTPVERLFKHINEPLPQIPNLPGDRAEAVNDVMQKATAKNPANRYPDALAFAVAFRHAAGFDRQAAPDVVESLTIREQEVLQRIIAGQANKEIAHELFVTVPTVKWHIRQVYNKLHVRSRPQAIIRARELQLIAPEKQSGQSLDALGALAETAEQRIPENPYKGLRAFQSNDSGDFFGREVLVEKLIQRMGESGELSRFLAVVGPSGSGKSSLVKAGLIPALWRGQIPESERWFIVEMQPGTHPLDELEVALLRVAANQTPNVREQLERDERGLIRLAQLILPNDGSQLVLVIDQFEEVFTLTRDESVRSRFLSILCQAVTDTRSRVRVVITLRADFYDRPLRYPDFGELVRSRMETVLPLSADGLERAIILPAERVGVTFEPGLVASIISEVNYQPGALPLLQYALTELFERSQDRVLTRRAYQAIGGTGGALAHRADELYQSLDDGDQRVVRQMFLRLVTLGEGVEDTGRRVLRTELMAIAAEDLTTPEGMIAAQDTMDDLIDSYAAYRLLSLDHDPITRSPTVELAHEAILREWERLSNWRNESREDIRIHRRLSDAASEWLNSKRDAGLLALGAHLDQFKSWYQKTTLTLNQTEKAYLETSFVADAERLALEEVRRIHTEKIARRAANSGRAAVLLAIIGILSVIAALVAAGQAGFAQSQMAASAATATALVKQMVAVEYGAAAVAELQNPLGNTTYAALLAIRSLKQQYYKVADEALMKAAADLPVSVYTGHEDQVHSVVVSRDGKTMLTSSADSTARLWDIETGQVVRIFSGHTDSVMSAIFSPDEKYVLTGSADFTAKLWETATGKLVRTFSGHTDMINCVAFSPNGKQIITGSDDSTAKIWDVQTETVLHTLRIVDTHFYTVAFTPDGHYVVTNGEGSVILIWDAATAKQIKELKGQLNGVWAVTFSPDSRYILSAGLDDTGRLWDIESGKMLLTLAGHSGSVRSVTISPDQKYLLTGSRDSTARLWDANTGQLIRVLHDHLGAIYGTAFTPDGNYILTASADHTIKRWTLAADQETRTFHGHSDDLYGVDVSSDGRYLATASGDKTARLWDTATGQVLHTLEGHTAEVFSVIFSPDSKSLLTTSFDYSSKLWDVATGKAIRTFSGHTGVVLGAAFTPDGKQILTSGYDQTVRLWSVATGAEVRIYKTHTNQIWDLAFTPDGKYFITGSTDNTAKLWEFASGKLVQTFAGHSDGIYSIAISPDGKYLLTGSRDQLTKLWRIETGEEIRTFHGHSGTVNSVAFSPDQRLVLTGSADRTARLWDINTGQQLRAYHGHTDSVWGVAFLPDGKHLITGGFDHTLKIWETDYQDFVSAICSRLLRDLTNDERQASSITDNSPTCNH